MCKSWNSIISDHKFARKHFNLSTTCNLHYFNTFDDNPLNLNSYSLESIFTDTNYKSSQLEFSLNITLFECNSHYNLVASCDGIICFANNFPTDYCKPFIVLWNPSIRKFKELPPFENQVPRIFHLLMKYGFGHGHVSHTYKLVVLCTNIFKNKTKVVVYSLSTDSWTSIQIPFDYVFGYQQGLYVRGTINWFVKWNNSRLPFIISIDLDKETYQKVFLPDEIDDDNLKFNLCEFRDCLSIIFYHNVWVMKEHGIKESWTKLFNISNLLDPSSVSSLLLRMLNIFEDDQVMLMFKKSSEWKLMFYNFKNGTFKVATMLDYLHLCVESLISPCL